MLELFRILRKILPLWSAYSRTTCIGRPHTHSKLFIKTAAINRLRTLSVRQKKSGELEFLIQIIYSKASDSAELFLTRGEYIWISSTSLSLMPL